MKIGTLLLVTLILSLSLSTSLATEIVPDQRQALVRILWGHRGDDYWEHTFPTGGDSVSYAFLFENPAGDDTLDLPTSAIMLNSDVDFYFKPYGAATTFIDTATRFIKAGEVPILGIQVWWGHFSAADTGYLRVEAFAD